jgi:monoterpene epsilon-lactone hydrolase
MGAFGPTLSGTTVDKVDTRTPAGHGVAGEWVSGPGARRVDAAIYYIHGSGYALCSPRTHRRLTAWLSRLTKLPIFSVDYPLAPRHRFPAAADDVHAGWEWLLSSTGLPPDRVIVAGDSAGGHLAVDLMLHGPLASRSAALVLFSRLVDLTLSLARARERLHRDPAIRAADAARLVQLYCRGVDPAHPRLALDVTRGPVLPPTLIQAGGAEFLSADAHRLAADIRTAGGDCELQVWPDQAHVFQALPRLTPEAAQAMRYVAAFISGALIDSGSGAAGIEQTG